MVIAHRLQPQVKGARSRGEHNKRWVWLSRVIHIEGFTLGAEIGVLNGRLTARLLKNHPTLRLFAVDLWAVSGVGSGQYDNYDFKRHKLGFDLNTAPYQRRLTVLRGYSWKMADKVRDNVLDFIFIDADHAYESVVKDIRAWAPKLRSGGMITGHDIHFTGVRRAVDELIPNWQHANMDHCWFARKEDVLL